MTDWQDDSGKAKGAVAMGTWGPGAFENDMAGDFAWTVTEGDGLKVLSEALDRVLLVGDGYLEAPDAQEGIAAAEIVARLRAGPEEVTSYIEGIDNWINAQKPVADQELAQKAKRAVVRVLTAPSELLASWKESKDFDDWKRCTEELAGRL